MIQEIIDLLDSVLTLPISPTYINGATDSIVYNHYVSHDDGAVAVYRLELRVIASSFENVEAYANTVMQTLLTVGDEPLTPNILGCELNGGGGLRDPNTQQYQRVLYFDVITRSAKYE